MIYNLGKTDRIVRAVAGPVMLAHGIYANSWTGCIGVWLLMTVFSKWCPVYSVFKFDTLPKDSGDSAPTSE